MSVEPRFSIIIPTYNRAHLIGKTITSILRQDFVDFEILVIDDGSKDNTREIIESFTDDRIHYFKKENAERGAARNYGVAKSRAKYINFFDSDDLMLPNHLGEANKLMENQPEFFHLAYDYRLESGETVAQMNNFDGSLSELILFNNKLSCNGVFLRKDVAMQYPFEEDRTLASSEDWELWIRLVCRFKLYYSNEITSTVVNHDQRSLRTIPADKVVARDLMFIDKLKEDRIVMDKYGRSFNRFIAERYTFFMLSLAAEGRRWEVLQWGIRAFAVHPLILLSKRFLASIKNSILR